MAKLLVLGTDSHARVPFLRGILTHSLQNCGLSFEESYKVASRVRDELASQSEITSKELREIVARHLQPLGSGFVEQYTNPSKGPATALVQYPDGNTTPYSRGQQRLELECCGLDVDGSAQLTARIHDELLLRGDPIIDIAELHALNHKMIRETVGAKAARRYVAWVEFQKSDRPLIVVIGGTPGTGKSTLATRLGPRLDIVRSQSTDMLREVMRLMVPERLLPVLHRSSFQAWRALPNLVGDETGTEAVLATGYLTQVELLSVAAEAVIKRALEERVSLIVEGVHVHPALLRRIPEETDAIVVPVMLAVLNSKLLRRRFRGRAAHEPARQASHYTDNFDAIWQLQSFLLSEADRTGIPIIANLDMERTLREVLTTVVLSLTKTFSGTPEEVFR